MAPALIALAGPEVTVSRMPNAGYRPQVIRDGERIVYASLPATKKWLTANKWQMAKPFAI